MRPMPPSQIVKTDDEIKAEMKAENAKPGDIAQAIAVRENSRSAVQSDYDKRTSAAFYAGLQRQNQ